MSTFVWNGPIDVQIDRVGNERGNQVIRLPGGNTKEVPPPQQIRVRLIAEHKVLHLVEDEVDVPYRSENDKEDLILSGKPSSIERRWFPNIRQFLRSNQSICSELTEEKITEHAYSLTDAVIALLEKG